MAHANATNIALNASASAQNWNTTWSSAQTTGLNAVNLTDASDPTPSSNPFLSVWEVDPNDIGATIICYALLFFFFGFFFVIIGIDMRRKAKCGELREDVAGLIQLCRMLARLPGKVLSGLMSPSTWKAVGGLFWVRSPKDTCDAEYPVRNMATAAAIERFSAKVASSSSATAVGSSDSTTEHTPSFNTDEADIAETRTSRDSVGHYSIDAVIVN